MADEYPFLAEYAKSSRSSCKGCKRTIEKDHLRIGVMIQSPSFDGRIPLWHHFDCFFERKQISSTDDLGNFASLRYEDQKRLKDKVGCAPTIVGKGSTSKGKKKAATTLNPFSVEITKAGRASCRVCQEKILKGEIRISKLDCESDIARRYGPSPGWHHVDCFVKVKDTLEFNLPLKELPGFETLEEDDQNMLKKKLKGSTMKRTAVAMDEEAVPNKKVKKEENEADKAMKAQSDLLFAFRDKAEAELSKEDIIALLEKNDQYIPSGMYNLLDALADCFVFGPLRRCPECNGKLRLKDRSYKCQGQVTEWTNCLHETEAPKRGKAVIPEEFSEKYDFLKNYKYVKRTRLFPPKADTSSNGSSSTSSKHLHKFKIALVGFKSDKQKELEEYIISLGGEVAKKISKSITCVVASEDNKEKYEKGMQMAKKNNVTVVAETFLTAAKTGKAAYILKNHSIKPWGVGISHDDASTSGTSKSGTSKSGQKTKKIVVQGVAEPDPDSGLTDVAEVVVGSNGAYNAVLGMVNVVKGTNSFYKIQLLRHRAHKKYYVFRAWGRVGTTIGGNKCEKFDSKDDAVAEFERLYNEKTGNEWICKDKFVKMPNLFYPLDIDYGQDDIDMINKLKPGKSSDLHKKIQELICLIFDVNAMKRALTEFEIDLEKMPLGKLSKKQIMKAYEILTELQNILQVSTDSDNKQQQVKILDASNRFYTLIPHDFGLEKPPLLDSEAIIKSKTAMLDSLLEIECAYKLLSDASSGDSQKDPIDHHYQQLKTDIEVLPKEGDEFKDIETYLKNTHAPTHAHYDLVLEDVFKINRHGEADRYRKKCDDMGNKKLLWHGSRLTNFAGILSQGLRIAPPEAPVTGYMFGKGIYFADMVSKSANYCYTNKQNPTGLLLLCEVALGNMVEKLQADPSVKLPKDKHSTKGMGATQPNPKQTVVRNGVEIPCGKPVKAAVKNSSLLYNEYIVYDVNQVNIKYLLKVHVKHKF